MLVDHMLCTIDGAQTTELGRMGSDISRAYANGALSEDEHQRLWEAIDARRLVSRMGTPHGRKTAPAGSLRPRRPRSPDRQASIERRRRIASAGAAPPSIACNFTMGEMAALAVIAWECRDHGCCSLHLDRIAAVAGVSRSTAKRALRVAARLGLVLVRERRRRGQRSLTNVITVVSAEWRLWLSKGGGVQKRTTTTTSTSKQASEGREPAGFGARWQRQWKPYDPGSGGERRWRRT